MIVKLLQFVFIFYDIVFAGQFGSHAQTLDYMSGSVASTGLSAHDGVYFQCIKIENYMYHRQQSPCPDTCTCGNSYSVWAGKSRQDQFMIFPGLELSGRTNGMPSAWYNLVIGKKRGIEEKSLQRCCSRLLPCIARRSLHSSDFP